MAVYKFTGLFKIILNSKLVVSSRIVVERKDNYGKDNSIDPGWRKEFCERGF